MGANWPLLRPLGIAAGGLGSVQAVTWGILSLLGILLYAGVIVWQPPETPSDQFLGTLVSMYFNRNDTTWVQILLRGLDIMTADTVVIWTSIYFGASVIWLFISGVLLHDSYKSKFTSNIIIGWVAFSAVVAVIDLAGTITFGLDYDTIKSLDQSSSPIPILIEPLLVPIFMMTMCARGFVLWLMNVALVIYLGAAATKLYTKGSPNLIQEPGNKPHYPPYISHYYDPIGDSMYNSPKADSPSQGRQNTAFQPDPINAWHIQPPTAGNQQPSQKDFSPKTSPRVNDVVNPIPPIPRIGKPVATPVGLQPTPQPDYSPPMPRQKHVPNMYEAPARPVLKKPNSQGLTYF